MYQELKIFILAAALAVYVMTCFSCVVIIKIAMRILIEKVDAIVERLEKREKGE